MTDDLVELVLRQAGLLGGRGHGVAFAQVRLTERGHRLLDLLRTKADLRGEVLDRRRLGHLAQNAVENAHRSTSLVQAARTLPERGRRPVALARRAFFDDMGFELAAD